MKLLSNINIGMAVGLLVFVLVTGSTLFLLRGIVQTLGLYLGNLPQLAFWNDMLAYAHESGDGWGWQGSWTVFYWAWTVTWSPFIGLFVARISRGRTIREFVLGVLLAPSAFTLMPQQEAEDRSPGAAPVSKSHWTDQGGLCLS